MTQIARAVVLISRGHVACEWAADLRVNTGNISPGQT